MSCFLTFLLILAVTLWVVFSATGGFARRSRQRQLLQQLGKQFGGVFRRGGFFKNPSLRVPYGDTWASVAMGNSRGPFQDRCLQVMINWPYAATQCEMFSRQDTDRQRNYFRVWPAIELHDDFNSQFEILAEDKGEVKQLLTSGVRWNIERLAAVGPNSCLHILIRDGRIFMQKPWKKVRPEVAAQFVQGALELYDQCMLAKATGIEFLNTDVAQPLEHVICKICGEEIQEQMVVCRRCKTPHHQDCWQYTGSCSVFGCRETRFISPQAGRS